MHTSLLWLCAAGPLLLIAVAMPSLSSSAPSSDRTRRSAAGPAFAASLAALAVALAAAAAWAVHGTLRTGTVGIAGVGFGIYLDGLTAVMLVLVAFVGAVVIRYSARYLDGDPNHARFMGWLGVTLAAVLLLIVSGNLFQFALAWVGTSVGLHRLLVFYGERPAAVLAARKKFLASRIGDTCLIAAMVLIHRVFGSLDYAGIFAAADALRDSGTDPVQSASVHGIALLLVVAALLKSAQFPLHGWLTEVMETPTPVSALLHAGIINAGGFLVLRLADVISLSMPSLHLLAVVGGLTALFGSVVMLTQTSVKVSLAYSTIAQMGFMMLQCGLGAYSAALLHIVAHSLYKAHAFLSSGSVIDIARASWSPSPGGRLHPARMTMAVAAVLAAVLVIGTLSGASLAEKPGVFALGAIMLFGLVHLIAGAIDERPTGYVIGRAAALAVLVATAYFALQFGAERLLAGSLPAVQGPGSPLDYAIVAAVVLGFGALTVFQNLMPRHAGEPRWQALHVHIANGFYVNTIANRLVLRFWPGLPPGRSTSQAATCMNGAHR
ncbi:NADH-quinone oxidoreductase subunit L [Skermanella rosea]|uniref:NADH-quinone oxidoreductase subunit L n=1 Tax=Skermanella rosea TaxID=1817965 RepID=UPI001933F178|nr:NADH-quinone oxidoreductase subunit L [Skermanella rosea]UEM06001.1 NADH-quinone oxidoreductase subunit L [Skermanella rosea]